MIVYRGFVIAVMIAAGSTSGRWHQSSVTPDTTTPTETRVATPSSEAMSITIAKIAGRAAFQPRPPLSKPELFSILLLMSQRPQGAQARS